MSGSILLGIIRKMTSYDEVLKFFGNGPLLRQAPFTSDDCRRACFDRNMYVGSELFAKQRQ